MIYKNIFEASAVKAVLKLIEKGCRQQPFLYNRVR